MDLFFEQVPNDIPKRRIHFHEFMIETHDYLHQARGERMDDILPTYAKDVAKEVRLLCFDEFHVTDVADAMILGRLFSALIKEDVIIVTTSNRPPEDLYQGGLQRDRFEPFVRLIRREMSVLHLDSDTDYRLQARETDLKTRFMTPLGDLARQWTNRIFIALSDGVLPSADVLNVKGRDILVEAAANGVARFSFAQLCEQPHGAEDYLVIARRYPTIVLENVPRMGYDRRNEAKRFITLIDTLYDEGTALYMTAEAAPEELYRGDHHAFEFQRTVSRLNEMGQNKAA